MAAKFPSPSMFCCRGFGMRFSLAAREWTMRRLSLEQVDGVVNILHSNIFEYMGDIYI